MQGRNRHDHFHGHAFNKFFGIDAALQFHIGKIGAKGMQPGNRDQPSQVFRVLADQVGQAVKIQCAFYGALDQHIAPVGGVTAARHEIKLAH